MTRTAKHTYPSPNSSIAAYGYNGFGGSAQASHGMSSRHTALKPGSSVWITDASGAANQNRR